jgi:hypothetical protein
MFISSPSKSALYGVVTLRFSLQVRRRMVKHGQT